jgi:hypothetical protein
LLGLVPRKCVAAGSTAVVAIPFSKTQVYLVLIHFICLEELAALLECIATILVQ